MSEALAATERDGALYVDVLVQPRASRVAFGPVVGDRLKVALTAPPVDGAANAALIAAFAEALRVPKRAVTIVRGETGRRKTVRLEAVSRVQLLGLIAP